MFEAGAEQFILGFIKPHRDLLNSFTHSSQMLQLERTAWEQSQATEMIATKISEVQAQILSNSLTSVRGWHDVNETSGDKLKRQIAIHLYHTPPTKPVPLLVPEKRFGQLPASIRQELIKVIELQQEHKQDFHASVAELEQKTEDLAICTLKNPTLDLLRTG